MDAESRCRPRRAALLPLAVVASLAWIACPARADDEPESVAAGAPRLVLLVGVDGAPGVDQVGFHLGVATELAPWDAGALLAGLLIGAHFYLPQSLPQPGVSYEVDDTALRVSGVAGHLFLLADRQLEIGTFLFGGPAFRFVRSSLTDPASSVDVEYAHTASLWELGAMLTLGWRITPVVGVSAVLALPLAVSGAGSVLESWLLAPPFLGVTLGIHLDLT